MDPGGPKTYGPATLFSSLNFQVGSKPKRLNVTDFRDPHPENCSELLIAGFNVCKLLPRERQNPQKTRKSRPFPPPSAKTTKKTEHELTLLIEKKYRPNKKANRLGNDSRIFSMAFCVCNRGRVGMGGVPVSVYSTICVTLWVQGCTVRTIVE